ncbi:hypothetical protein H6F42_15940 [Pseudanabaena sp. FACHB-1998]|uniref:hypothetical protein n=1 Tax=Pseudanabaena sp. FACHB-1998 TaxID=2692858 RepID=UPI001680AFBA|nr:hypothetical protein [Pseudanabaena sp. FACHB-1998]MBD2178411.1 hypothetical protein [Pseudanabaena sp. FACHB-1998]
MLFPFSQLPTGDRAIVTVEEMITYCASLLGETSTETYIAQQGAQPRKVASIGFGEDYNQIERYQAFAVIQKKAGISDGSALPAWKRVGLISNLAVPPSFLD